MSQSTANSIYLDLQYAYNFYNEKLFEGKLEPTLMTLQRHKNMLGYISFDRFSEKNGQKYLHELAMNSDYFAYRTTIETLSTLVHEQVHLAQRQFGTPPTRAYHDHEFKDMMFSIGLMTSQTGKPDGKPVGQNMDHYILKKGKFLEVSIELLNMGFELPIYERYTPKYINPIQFYQDSLEFIERFEDVLKPEYLRPLFLNEILLNKAKQDMETSKMIDAMIMKKDAIIKPELETDVSIHEDSGNDNSIVKEEENYQDEIKISTIKDDDLKTESVEGESKTGIIEIKVESVEEIISPIKELLSIAEEDLIEAPKPVPNKNKCKYKCDCNTNIWGKPNLNVICGDCSSQFILVL